MPPLGTIMEGHLLAWLNQISERQVIAIADLDPAAPQTIAELLAIGPAGRQRHVQLGHARRVDRHDIAGLGLPRR